MWGCAYRGHAEHVVMLINLRKDGKHIDRARESCLGWLQIVDRMVASANGTGTVPLFLYSGHDTTIMPILATLGIKLEDWPEYVSNVVSTFLLTALLRLKSMSGECQSGIFSLDRHSKLK